MDFSENLLDYFKKPKEETENQSPEGVCPLCWGYQEYDSKTRVMSYDKQIDVKNHIDKNVKVGKFMVEHVDGFKNKKRIVERCPDCGGKRIIYKENP